MSSDAPKTLDDFLKLGKYTVLVCVFIELLLVVQCGNILFMVFAGATPTIIHCKNMTTVPEGDLCTLYHSGQCDPVLEYQFFSVNMEFERLCDHTVEIKDSTTYQLAGYAIGSLVFGQLSDTYGRKWPIFICSLLNGILGIALSFCTSLQMFSILKLIITFICTGHIVSCVVFMSETYPKNHRMWMFFVFSWSPNIVIVTVLAYFCQDWRTFSFVLNSLCFVACGVLFFVHETAHFLVRKGRVEEAEYVMKRIYELDGNELDMEALEDVLVEEKLTFEAQSTENYSYHHLFVTWKFIFWIATIMYGFFAVSMIAYGVMFNLETMSGSLYFKAALNGVFRTVFNIACALADFYFPSFTRKKAHFIFGAYTLFAIAAAMLMQMLGMAEDFSILYQCFFISACSMVCQIFCVVGVASTEIFPTPIRNMAFAITQFSEAIGSMVAPQLFILNQYAYWLPFATLIILLSIEMITYQLSIPETKGMPLADKMPPPEEWISIFRLWKSDEKNEKMTKKDSRIKV